MEENFDIREQQLTTKERDFENALRPLNFEDFSGQDKVAHLCQGGASAGRGVRPCSFARTSRLGQDDLK